VNTYTVTYILPNGSVSPTLTVQAVLFDKDSEFLYFYSSLKAGTDAIVLAVPLALLPIVEKVMA
jgi:hypothetical protein